MLSSNSDIIPCLYPPAGTSLQALCRADFTILTGPLKCGQGTRCSRSRMLPFGMVSSNILYQHYKIKWILQALPSLISSFMRCLTSSPDKLIYPSRPKGFPCHCSIPYIYGKKLFTILSVFPQQFIYIKNKCCSFYCIVL